MSREVTIINVKDIQAVEENIGRAGKINAKEMPVPTGVPGIEMDFTWTTFSKEYGTPRHRHTFEQVRYVIDGNWGSELATEHCGYYPEGVYYGPQQQDAATTVLFLQFPGPSAIRYLKHTELDKARRQLIAEGGVFANGIYTRVLPDGRKINKDSFAACSEAITGVKTEFPRGRFGSPVFMRPEDYRWVPDRHLPGVEHKHLGTFGEWRTGLSLTRIARGAKIPARRQDDAEIRFLLEGSMTYAGETWQGGKTEDVGTYMYIPHEADLQEIRTATGVRFFSISLPTIAEMERLTTGSDQVVRVA
jgi:hypothetical protein